MSEDFFSLSRNDQREALLVAASRSGRAAHLLEKDIWVVWTLRALYPSEFASHLVFKGGTSLSKAYQAIARFSEDVDLTYDIRAIASDLVGHATDPIPKNRSQQDRWTDAIRERLPKWIEGSVLPLLNARLADEKLEAEVTVDGDQVLVQYAPLAIGTGYVRPIVLLEFGARSTGEPFERRIISCDASSHIPEVTFPEVSPQVMRAERTFWEKATAIHVFCRGGKVRGSDRFSRHWYDLVGLEQTGYARSAISDRELARSVARHKAAFFRENDGNGRLISYDEAVSGSLHLVPEDGAMELLSQDYAAMLKDGLFFTEPPAFDALIESCRAIQDHANAGAEQ
jgi:hypothetical protein